MRLDGQVAIVTGGISGIGLAVVKKFLENGAKVVVADYDDTKVNDLASLNSQDVRFLKVDVSDPEQVRLLIERTIKTFGKLDIMVANAGIGVADAIDTESIETYQKVININLNGVYYCNKYAIIEMIKQGHGSIINTASILGLVGQEGAHAYTTAKGGIVNMTRGLAVTYAKNNIRVNAVAPGYILTPMIESIPEEMKQALIALHPIGRMGKPEEVANAICFLASNEASFITGVTLPVDGGYTAR